MRTKICVLGLCATVLGACGPSGNVALSDPNSFDASFKNGVLSGSYNPAGFDTRLVQNQIKAVCIDEALSAYREQPREDGLIAFSANCTAGSTFGLAFMNIKRLPDGNFSVTITGT